MRNFKIEDETRRFIMVLVDFPPLSLQDAESIEDAGFIVAQSMVMGQMQKTMLVLRKQEGAESLQAVMERL